MSQNFKKKLLINIRMVINKMGGNQCDFPLDTNLIARTRVT